MALTWHDQLLFSRLPRWLYIGDKKQYINIAVFTEKTFTLKYSLAKCHRYKNLACGKNSTALDYYLGR